MATTELYISLGRMMSTTDKSIHLIRENDEHNRILNISSGTMMSTTDKSVHLLRENDEHNRQKRTPHQGE